MYKPSLWYYKLFDFYEGTNEPSRRGIDTLDDVEEVSKTINITLIFIILYNLLSDILSDYGTTCNMSSWKEILPCPLKYVINLFRTSLPSSLRCFSFLCASDIS